MAHGPDEILTRPLDPADVTQASRSAWRRSVGDAIEQSARLMAGKDMTTAERVRLAALVGVLVRALETV